MRLTLICIVVAAALIGGCQSTPQSKSTPITAQHVAGSYCRGDLYIMHVKLTLETNGFYNADWLNHLRRSAWSYGRWELRNDRIHLIPQAEEGTIHRPIRTLEPIEYAGSIALIPTDDRSAYEKEGVTLTSCFQRTEHYKKIFGPSAVP